MVKLSVSKAARMLGISRVDIQVQINNGKLQTHEGYVTTDSLRLAYPKANLYSEQDQHIQKIQRIKDNAVFKAGSTDAVNAENHSAYVSAIATLKNKLYQEKTKIQRYERIFKALNEKLARLEAHCPAENKAHLHNIQLWVNQQR